MMKLMTDEWVSAEVENKHIRDAKREEFWESLGVNRARDLGAIDISPTDRLDNVQRLFSKAGDKLNDVETSKIISLASLALKEIGPGTPAFLGTIIPLTMKDLTVFARSQFFQTNVVPNYDLTRMD
ncbi:hypothetical protein GOZ90_19695 [Agrobacterium vitis]|uniref:Uncharacterized protein n=1 Tax=Agrobacterium vitis TaxID=373 RepID=A0A6L6VH50_AGRVI|nr:hypothetical protein [Agrobacterium vitis]MUZ74916.1 hypothetical protein [Agrobacterium vitis]MVA19937.1 hypothetical protein [Agrobacterium vitis]